MTADASLFSGLLSIVKAAVVQLDALPDCALHTTVPCQVYTISWVCERVTCVNSTCHLETPGMRSHVTHGERQIAWTARLDYGSTTVLLRISCSRHGLSCFTRAFTHA